MYLLFLAFWIILNGKCNLEILLFGIFISLAVYLFCWKYLGYSPQKELSLCQASIYLFRYGILLLAEIAKANISVLKEIYSVKTEVEPCVIQFRSPLKKEFLNVILANSITLTPGTITLEVDGQNFTVHCLDKSMSEGMDNSDFVKLLCKIETCLEEKVTSC